jgi:hypothetical protein
MSKRVQDYDGALEIKIDDNTPLRLAEAAETAFPDGGVTAATLRREWKRGKLVVYRIGNKDFTTLGDIARMREQCHAKPNHPDSGSGLSAVMNMGDSLTPQPGSSLTADDNLILESVLTTLEQRSARSQTI